MQTRFDLNNLAVTCRNAAFASSASADSVMATSAVGVPAVGVVAGERRGVDVRENSSVGVPKDQKAYLKLKNTWLR